MILPVIVWYVCCADPTCPTCVNSIATVWVRSTPSTTMSTSAWMCSPLRARSQTSLIATLARPCLKHPTFLVLILIVAASM